MKNIILSTWLLCLTLSGMAQISYEKRIEFKSEEGYYEPTFIPMGKSGLLAVSKKKTPDGDNSECRYQFYNTDLGLENTSTTFVHRDMFTHTVKTNSKRNCVLHADRKGNFSIISFDISSLEVSKIDGAIPETRHFNNFKIFGDYAILSARTKKLISSIIIINLNTGDIKYKPVELDGIDGEDIIVEDIQVLEKQNEVYVYLEAPGDKKKEYDKHVIILDEKGEKKNVYNLTKDFQQRLYEIAAFPLEKEECVFIGTTTFIERGRDEGLFFAKTSNGKLDNIAFYDFFELDNFFSTLPEDKHQKLRKEKEKANKKGKEYGPDYYLSEYDIIPVADGYIFLGQLYASYYGILWSNGNEISDIYYGSENTSFKGYNYSHAIAVKFDQEGKKVWDNAFELFPILSDDADLQHITILDQSDDEIQLTYGSRDRIFIQTIDEDDGEITEDFQSEVIEHNPANLKINEVRGNIEPWYDDYYVVHGSQHVIPNFGLKTKEDSWIYFVQKIEIE